MPFSRRSFIRSASILSTLTLTELDVLANLRQIDTGGSDISADDESYWLNVRQLFPLSREWTYLNNGTFGPSPYPVIEAVRKGMMDTDQSGIYNGYEEAPAKLAKFVGANDNEIALTHNVTEGINIACWGLPLKRGDEVILTTHEHVGNAFPWLNRQKLHGIALKVFTPASTAEETLNRIASLITRRTRVIAVPHIPCTQGQVLPIRDICTLAREKGVFSVIDGAHGPGMVPLDLHAISCDTYASCCHKWMLGPKGTGFLYIRKDFQDTLQAYFVGGGGDSGPWDMSSIPITSAGYAPSAHRYYGGTQNLGLYKGVMVAVDFLDTIGMSNVYSRIHALGSYAQQRLLELGNKVELLTPLESQSRAGMNGFRIKGIDHNKYFTNCMNAKVRIRAVSENNLNCLRVSTHIYNSKADIDKLIELVRTA